jgi:hypothetical protein
MIAFVVAIVAIAAIWLMGEQDIARHELIIKLSASAAIISLFPFVWGWKLFTIPKKSFQIILGRVDPYTTIEPSGANLTRTVRAMLKNNTRDGVSNGELRLLNLNPPNDEYKDFLLEDRIIIGPRSSTFIDIAAYNEGTPEAPVGSWIQLIIPNPGGYFMPATFGHLPIRSHTFHLQFSSLDDIFDDICCRIFVDSDHVLHLEGWS